MRAEWVVGAVVLWFASCSAPIDDTKSPTTWAETLAPPSSVRLPFASQGPCTERTCVADELMTERVKDVVITREGGTVKVALTHVAWDFFADCSIAGCPSTWLRRESTRCFDVTGETVTPTTACTPGARFPFGPIISAPTINPLTLESALRPGLGVSVGGGWLGDVATDARSDGWWDFQTRGEAQFAAFVKDGKVAWWLPSLGNRPFTAGLIAPPAVDAVYWADPVDRLSELRATADAFLVRPVREAQLPPKTTTRGVLEDGDDVFTVVESAAGLPTRSPSLMRVSLLRSRKLDAPEEPLLPFGLVSARATSPDQVIACFTEPLDETSLSAAQFVGGDGLEVKALVASPAAQCAVLSTSLMRAGVASTVRVTGLRSRAGRPLSEVIFSVTGPPLSTGRDLVSVARLAADGPLGGALEVGLPEGDLFASTVGAWGRRDTSGKLVRVLGESATTLLPTRGGLFADPHARAVFALVSGGASDGPLRLERRTPAGVDVLEDAQGSWSPNLLVGLGDGSAFITARTSGTLLRARFPGGVTPFPPTLLPFAVDPWTGEFLVNEGGRARVGRLDDGTLGSESWAAPAVFSVFEAKAVKSGTRRWVCSGNGLVLLGETTSPLQEPCEHVSVDPDGVPWVTLRAVGLTPSRLARLDGDRLVLVPLPHPFDAAKQVHSPEFVGDWVFTNQLTLRFSLTEWRALAGGTP